MKIHFRLGEKRDCVKIAEGIDKASGGIIAFLYEDIMEDPVTLMAAILEKEEGNDTYRNAFIAENDQQVVGMVYSYPAKFHGISREMREFFSKERLDHVVDFFSTRLEDSLLLDSIYVEEEMRGHGIGKELVELTKKKAKSLGYSKVSLMVMADNHQARTVYEKSGFSIVKHVHLDEHRLIPHKGGVYLMACQL